MKNRYQLLLEKYCRFNDWEINYNKQICAEEHLEQFAELYAIGQSMDPDVIEKLHQEHLNALIEVRMRLKSAAANCQTK